MKHAEVQTIYGMRLQNPQERQVSYTPYPRQLGEREREENEKKALAGQSPTLGHFSRKACVLQLGGAAFVSLHDILTLRSSH